MNRLFHSATIQLTTWYVVILSFICLLFSIVVYQVTVGEVEHRLASYHNKTRALEPLLSLDRLSEINSQELIKARANLIIALVYFNLIMIGTGGVGAYFLAKRTLRPVETAHEQQTRFVSDASHELRTPLATMTLELETALRDKTLTKAEMKELLRSNLEEVQRLTGLSNILLALSVGKTVALEQTPFDITTSLQELQARYNQSRLQISSPKKPIMTIGHQPSIEELLTILADNAFKYSPADSPVSINVIQQQHKAVISVINSGPGITAEQLPRIFDRFYRADSARSSTSGYGLGLSLAKQISDLHNADLTATSQPGVSTQFRFSLPIAKKK